MALSHLLRPKSGLKFNICGFQKPVRSFSSQISDAEVEKPSKWKKTVIPKQQRAVAVESFVKKYMEMNQGVFPKASHIQNELGGSWYTVKEILCNIKEKILGTPPLENHHIIDASATVEGTASSASMTSHSMVHGNSGSVVNPNDVLQPRCKDVSFVNSTTEAALDAACALKVDPTASDVIDMHKTPGSCEHRAASTVQCINSELDIHASQADASEKVAVHTSMKYNSEGMVQRNAVTDNSQPDLDSDYIQPKESVSNMSETSDNGLVSRSDKFSHFRCVEMNSTGCHERQENKTMTSDQSPNSSVKVSPKSTTDNSQKVSRLADIFKKFRDDASVADAENGKMESEISLSNILLSHGKDRDSQVKSLFSTDVQRPSKSTNKLHDFNTNKFVSDGFENLIPEGEMVGSSMKQNVIPNMAEMFTGPGYFMGFGDTKTVNSRVSEFLTNKKKDISRPALFGHLEGSARKDETARFEIKELVERIKGFPGEPSTARQKDNISSCKADESSQKNQLGINPLASFKSFDKKDKNMSSDCRDDRGTSKNDNPPMVLPVCSRTQGDAESSPDCTEQRGPTKLAVPTDGKESKDTQENFSVMKELQNKAVVKFLLGSAKKQDILDAFRSCGDILKVELLSSEQAIYRTANIYFKTREGLRKALEKTEIIVRNWPVIVEAAASRDGSSNKISIPRLIGDPDVPAGLVKNPMRTVKITQLTHDICSDDIIAALGSYESNVTGFFFGVLDSVAFVEFETEDGKELALAKHFVDVLGKRLLLSRIDAPRTTVVRISHDQCVNKGSIVQYCQSLGTTNVVRTRRPGILDIYYKLAEWPNMLKILNRLNAAEVDGHTLLAQPASIFPPEILRVLWSHPEERKHLRAAV